MTFRLSLLQQQSKAVSLMGRRRAASLWTDRAQVRPPSRCILCALAQPVVGAEARALGPPPASIPSSSGTSAVLGLPCVPRAWKGH